MRKPSVMSLRHPLAATELIRCVVIESGSLPLTDADAENFDQTLVIAQMQDEPSSAFAERTLERLVGVERSGRRFTSITLQAGNQRDAAAQAARRRIVLALAAHAQATPGFGMFTLRAAREAAPEHRAELLDLAADVMAYRGGCAPDAPAEPVGVRLRFDAGAPAARRQSGTFQATPDRSVRLRRTSSRTRRPGTGT
jgi:hypothetical protein